MCPQDINRYDNSVRAALYNKSRVFLYRHLRPTAGVQEMLESIGWSYMLRSFCVSLHQTQMYQV